MRPDRLRKSVGRERTYAEDLVSSSALFAALEEITSSVWHRIQHNGVSGRTVTLKVKFADFRQITRSRSCEHDLSQQEFAVIARELLAQLLPVPLGVRLLGLTLSGLAGAYPEKSTRRADAVAAVQQAFDF